jgi:hypothetical protein
MDFSERLLADFACLDPVYIDDAAAALNLGANCQLLLFRWQCVSRSAGEFEKVPAVNLVFSRTSVLARSGIIASWMKTSTPPKNIATPRAVTH